MEFPMQLHVVTVLTLSVVTAAVGADTNGSRGICEPYNDALPGTRIEVGKSFSSFTLPSGLFKVFYAVLGKESALDLIRVHCVLDVPKGYGKDFSYVQVTASNGRSSISFSLPKLLGNDTLFYEDAHTIAPLEVDDFDGHHMQVLTATVSSRALETVVGKIRFANYDRSQYHVILPPSSPKVKVLVNQRAGYVRPLSYRLASEGIECVRVLIESEDDLCAKLTISEKKNFQQNSWRNEGSRTMDFTRRLDLMLCGHDFKNVVLMHIEVYPDDTRCSPQGSRRNPNKLKIFNITCSKIEGVNFLMPVTVSMTCFFLPVICALAYVLVSKKRDFNHCLDEIELYQTSRSEQIGYSTDNTHLEDRSNDAHGESTEQQDEDDTLSTHATVGEGGVVIKDVQTGSQQQECSWTCAQFALILLPVLSLVASSPALGVKSKDEYCFHNYACAEPLGVFSSFNHVFSNFGYAFSGVFFLIFARMRKKKPTLGYGIHANYEIELSMGLSLLCESLASSIYHICPNSATYSLDTPFIEITCVLLILKVYGSRRNVVTSQHVNVGIASVITLNIIITMFGENFAVRVLATAVLITASLLSMSVVLFGPRLSLSFLWSNSERNVSIIAAICACVVNISLIVVCNLTSYRTGSSQLVTISCIVNTFLYLLYYVIMKYRKKEKWCKFSKRCVVTAVLLWLAALFFFFTEETDWTLTPAQSRAVNRPCVLLNFFDYHDLWHMTSALASVFLLIGVSSLDDDLCAISTGEFAIF